MHKRARREIAHARSGSGSLVRVTRIRKSATKTIAIAVLIAALVGVQYLPAAYNPRALAQTSQAWVQTTVADFSGCGISNGASVTNVDGGEIRLPALVEDYFDGSTLDTTRWYEPDGPLSAIVMGGLCTINASSIRSVASVGDADLPVAVEGRIRFGDPNGGSGWGDFGLGKEDEVPGPPNVLFISDDLANVYANDYQPGAASPQRTQIANFDWAGFQNVRFVLYADRVDY